jgi:hypothetical protein
MKLKKSINLINNNKTNKNPTQQQHKKALYSEIQHNVNEVPSGKLVELYRSTLVDI